MDQYLDTLNDKESKVLDQYDALRAIWGDILQGFSYLPSKKIYIKHLNDIDHSSIAKKQTEFLKPPPQDLDLHKSRPWGGGFRIFRQPPQLPART